MATLLIATRNAHKVGEIRGILGPAFPCVTLRDYPSAPAVVEDAPTFEGNALKKAIQLAHWLSSCADPSRPLPDFVLADDSGLEVDALHGAPGVHSARFAAQDLSSAHLASASAASQAGGGPGFHAPSASAGNTSDADNNARLLQLLREVPAEKRTARFRCVVALTPTTPAAHESASAVCYADEAEWRTEIFNGTCEGRISFTPAGAGGFGYDPLFVPDGHDRSFAELGEDVKNRISHRARALEQLREWFLKRGVR